MPAKENKSKAYSLKICPECSTRLPVDTRRCFSCHAKVGIVDVGGRAKRSFNWLAYTTCFFHGQAFSVISGGLFLDNSIPGV
ncbi:MAG: hypothetical protein QF888_05130 [Desulfobacterales bacterium]|nr:hypothetical protein [Desulfobacterales bacterium]